MSSSETSTKALQFGVASWTEKNFGLCRGSNDPLLGIVEETGELCHAILKRKQGIRGTKEEHDAAIRDAIGDIVIFLMDFCNEEQIILDDCISEAWSQVVKRDWKVKP